MSSSDLHSLAMSSAAATFASLEAALKADPALGKKVGGTLKFALGDSDWFVDCLAGEVTSDGGDKKADVTITMSEADVRCLASIESPMSPHPNRATLNTCACIPFSVCSARRRQAQWHACLHVWQDETQG